MTENNRWHFTFCEIEFCAPPPTCSGDSFRHNAALMSVHTARLSKRQTSCSDGVKTWLAPKWAGSCSWVYPILLFKASVKRHTKNYGFWVARPRWAGRRIGDQLTGWLPRSFGAGLPFASHNYAPLRTAKPKQARLDEHTLVRWRFQSYFSYFITKLLLLANYVTGVVIRLKK